MKIFYSIIFLIFSCNSFASSANFMENEEVHEFITMRAKELLAEENAFSDFHDIKNIEVKIDFTKLKNLPDSVDRIDKIETTNINKVSSTFKINIYTTDPAGKQSNEIFQGYYKENLEIPALKKRMPTGYIIEASDLELIKVDAKKIGHEIITDLAEIVGKTPKYSIPAHTSIRREMIINPNIINKKDMVTAIFKKGNLELKMIGIALDSGSAGDTIRIQNSKSDAVLQGIAQSDKTVFIH